MRRLALVLAVLGICAIAGACDGGRGVTEPAGRVQNIGTMGSGHRDGTGGDSTVTMHDNGGTIGSGHRESVGGDSLTVTTRNGGTSGSGH
jgi:hypothetical protein